MCGGVPTLESGSVEGRSCEVLAACRGHEVGAPSRTEPSGEKKKSARFLEIIAGRLHPEPERGEGARALKTALGWAKDASQAPLIHLVLLDLFFFFFFFK